MEGAEWRGQAGRTSVSVPCHTIFIQYESMYIIFYK